ncbi:MAG: type II toxin-antitoxin system RelB/DinJ family antitoxin [Lachnospiraceae bacterium]|nr:type II toxin-antitoxin system RelB/DinJ family antitoxin [Lachnospiraceae bacterium]
MAQTMINFRMDEELKKSMEETCKDLGLSMTAAFTIFAKKMTREKRIPFDVSIDPFYLLRCDKEAIEV